MAKPRKKLPEKTVDISCAKCRTVLFKYHKGGKGALIKCFNARIAQDATQGDGRCPNCGSEFAREAMIRGAPAWKIAGGKVVVK
ncbi:hypothetical protein [Vibrio furnissii]|uniref:hypothetical protein n=1 Tax=Vibrio furnissii TaxID=29494 RepID=UPI00056F9F99|nr:hypothetical protein [Vibrio furnissii]UON51102.1 hypothetical protein IUJ52_19460 [Vibrio furnissii]WJG23863.1 hypothetical protein QSU95_22965 [Vibrio furnissii]SUQ33433.1 Conserved protein containing a Zn-ribbon motif [Vibrio furnissii]